MCSVGVDTHDTAEFYKMPLVQQITQFLETIERSGISHVSTENKISSFTFEYTELLRNDLDTLCIRFDLNSYVKTYTFHYAHPEFEQISAISTIHGKKNTLGINGNVVTVHVRDEFNKMSSKTSMSMRQNAMKIDTFENMSIKCCVCHDTYKRSNIIHACDFYGILDVLLVNCKKTMPCILSNRIRKCTREGKIKVDSIIHIITPLAMAETVCYILEVLILMFPEIATKEMLKNALLPFYEYFARVPVSPSSVDDIVRWYTYEIATLMGYSNLQRDKLFSVLKNMAFCYMLTIERLRNTKNNLIITMDDMSSNVNRDSRANIGAFLAVMKTYKICDIVNFHGTYDNSAFENKYQLTFINFMTDFETSAEFMFFLHECIFNWTSLKSNDTATLEKTCENLGGQNTENLKEILVSLKQLFQTPYHFFCYSLLNNSKEKMSTKFELFTCTRFLFEVFKNSLVRDSSFSE